MNLKQICLNDTNFEHGMHLNIGINTELAAISSA